MNLELVESKGDKRAEYQRRYKQAHQERVRAAGLAWYRRNREKVLVKHRRRQLEALYGMTISEYSLLLTHQEGKCAICRRESATQHLAVDHDHKTGKIRGLLCNTCNLALGHLGKNPAWLLTAIQYVAK